MERTHFHCFGQLVELPHLKILLDQQGNHLPILIHSLPLKTLAIYLDICLSVDLNHCLELFPPQRAQDHYRFEQFYSQICSNSSMITLKTSKFPAIESSLKLPTPFLSFDKINVS